MLEVSGTGSGAVGSLTAMLGSKLELSPDQAKTGVGAMLAYAEGSLPSRDFQKGGGQSGAGGFNRTGGFSKGGGRRR